VLVVQKRSERRHVLIGGELEETSGLAVVSLQNVSRAINYGGASRVLSGFGRLGVKARRSPLPVVD
jgi:hypothetical protein